MLYFLYPLRTGGNVVDYLESYYNQYDEEGRLLSQHGQVEYITTQKYIHDFLADDKGKKILEVGAGTGRYSVALAGEAKIHAGTGDEKAGAGSDAEQADAGAEKTDTSAVETDAENENTEKADAGIEKAASGVAEGLESILENIAGVMETIERTGAGSTVSGTTLSCPCSFHVR